jgi:hypothetical protein
MKLPILYMFRIREYGQKVILYRPIASEAIDLEVEYRYVPIW